jgi:hypothetical protein
VLRSLRSWQFACIDAFFDDDEGLWSQEPLALERVLWSDLRYAETCDSAAYDPANLQWIYPRFNLRACLAEIMQQCDEGDGWHMQDRYYRSMPLLLQPVRDTIRLAVRKQYAKRRSLLSITPAELYQSLGGSVEPELENLWRGYPKTAPVDSLERRLFMLVGETSVFHIVVAALRVGQPREWERMMEMGKGTAARLDNARCAGYFTARQLVEAFLNQEIVFG